MLSGEYAGAILSLKEDMILFLDFSAERKKMTSIVLTSCGNLPIIKQVAWLLGQVMNALFNVLDLIGIPNIGLAIFYLPSSFIY